MSNQIFVSYSSKDKERVKKLVAVLEERVQDGRVWWDKKIPPGKNFDRALGQALDKSACIVVVWSKNSIRSDWVLEEAYEGKTRRIIIPIMLENSTKIPFSYRLYHAINFASWRGGKSANCVNDLVKAVSKHMGPVKTKNRPTKASVKKTKRRLSGGLDGKTIVFTGRLAQTRNAHAEKVEAVGAEFVNSGVTSKTDFLVVGKKPGMKKLKDARRHGVKRLKEKQWHRLLNNTYKRILLGKKLCSLAP